MVRLSRNVSIILSPEPNYSLMQIRDDIEGNPIQFFGGWMKGFWPKYEGEENEESIEHAIYREMVNELGLALREAFFLPFPGMNDYTLQRAGKKNSIVYLTKAMIKPEWIGNRKRVKKGEETIGRLNLREGSSMDIFRLDETLLEENLYGNDRRMLKIYLEHRDAIEQAAFKLSLENLHFPDEEGLEELITVRT